LLCINGIKHVQVCRVLRPTRLIIGHFGDGLHSQSLDCYWQTNNKENTQYKAQKTHINTIQIKERNVTKQVQTWTSCDQDFIR